ncbi:MAG: NAD(P)H-dependent oxidoreductase subunit E, partial [Burkholderiales bacterium]
MSKARFQSKGRPVDPLARAVVAELAGHLEPRRDLLIEALHCLQDAHHCLRPAEIAALAERFGLSQAEVFEVATFYHHFDVLRDDERPLPPL